MPDSNTPPSADDSFLMTVREVAAELRVSNMTVHREIKAGRLGAIRIGKQFRIPDAELAAYKKRNTTGGPQ
jgi:excisionase family DNA binding protein